MYDYRRSWSTDLMDNCFLEVGSFSARSAQWTNSLVVAVRRSNDSLWLGGNCAPYGAAALMPALGEMLGPSFSEEVLSHSACEATPSGLECVAACEQCR